MKKSIVFFIVFSFILGQNTAQNPSIKRIDPTNWWVGMKNPALQLMIYGNNIKGSKVSINYEGVSLQNVTEVENPNYLFVDLLIAPHTKAGKFMVELSKTVQTKDNKNKIVDQNLKLTQPYELKVRDQKPQEINSKDFI